MKQYAQVREIQDEYHERHRLLPRWTIVQEAHDSYSIHAHTADGVAPPSTYPNRRLAAARLLQLLGIGPVAPQSHPEDVCVGTITREVHPEN